ncbi:hypothetical protein AVEN_85187-1 [Araneus ventricosus]|uniref:TIL domain-containing protein n=1 Tax=Araneus ventricosus TaxID=182803 RepID=A0A4Y2T7F5_ARAVE|nr:hypothetical protein AVEN_85187-1 [Araneus ventricosus]
MSTGSGTNLMDPITGSDTDDYTNDTHEEQGVTVTTTTDPRHLHLSRAEVIPRYKDLLQKVRKVVLLFKRSPTIYDMYLKKYVKEDTGKELSLILDCRTRWNCLLAMIERFHKLKVCIDKALIDIGTDTTFSDLEWLKIKDLIESLQPFKLAVEALCRRNSTLLTAETTVKFILEKLVTQDTMLSAELSEALRVRIKERRTVVTGILIYLQNPKNMIMIQDELMIHLLCQKKVIRLEMKIILERVIQDDRFNETQKMLLLSNIVSLALPILFISELVTAQTRRCSRNEEWSYPVDGCNTCIPVTSCEVRQEYGCNCRSGYTRDVIFGNCIRSFLCPLAPATSTSTMGPTSTTTESPTTSVEPTTTTTESSTAATT